MSERCDTVYFVLLRGYWNFAFHTTPQVFEYSKQGTRWLLSLSNSFSLLYSVFLEFKLLSGLNDFFQEKRSLLFHLIHTQEILKWQYLSLPLKSLQRALTNFCFLKLRPYTSHMKTWSPRWDISPPDNTTATMQPLKCDHGWTWARPSQGKKKLLSEQFTRSASSYPSAKQSRLIRVARKEMLLIHLHYLVLVTNIKLSRADSVTAVSDEQKKINIYHTW